MTQDPWTFVVLGLALVCMVRPLVATFARRQSVRIDLHRQALIQSSSGAAMLVLAAYLWLGARPLTGRGYLDLLELGLSAPFMLWLPEVWLPPLCLVLIVILGARWLAYGVRHASGKRDPASVLWAMNETAVCCGLLWWQVYLPGDWAEATLLNFALKGIYLAFAVGSGVRLLLAMRGPGGSDPVLLASHGASSRGTSWVGRFRRF